MTKLMQLNMWAGRLEHSLKDFTAAERPDILCLQEAVSFAKGDAGMFFTIEKLQKALALRYVSFAPVFSFKLMNGIAEFGNAVISRFPIEKSEVVFTYLSHKENFDFNDDDYNVRNFIHTVINVEGAVYNVLTHHGYHVPEHKQGNQETMRQMQLLADYIDQLTGNIILAGDLNLAPRSKSIELINSRLTNQSIAHKLKSTRNALTHKTEVCDYIFNSQGVDVKSFRAAEELISDHKALIMEF